MPLYGKIYLLSPIVGLCLCLLCLALLPFPALDPLYLKGAILLLLLPAGVAAVLLTVSVHGNPLMLGAKVYAGCPLWLRRLTYAVIGIGVVSLLVAKRFGAQAPIETLAGSNSTFVVSMFGIVTFAATFSQIYSSVVLRERARRAA